MTSTNITQLRSGKSNAIDSLSQVEYVATIVKMMSDLLERLRQVTNLVDSRSYIREGHANGPNSERSPICKRDMGLCPNYWRPDV